MITAPIYLDCAATTPIDPRVREAMLGCLDELFGNAGSRTHQHGLAARRMAEQARDQVAQAAGCGRGEVVFTSGATESNNLAILGLAAHGRVVGARHLVSTAIEHRAVLEPLQRLQQQGFELTLVPVGAGGRVCVEDVIAAVRDDTLLVSVMQVNNETGVVQPVAEIAERLGTHSAYLHVDAAQGFGKLALTHTRVDMLSLSGHKIHAPKGVGALVARRRGRVRPPLEPLMVGGGQELGLRPGTLPVAQVVGLGCAAELASREADQRAARCEEFRLRLLAGLAPLQPQQNGDERHCVPGVINLSLLGRDAEQVMENWRELVSISDGAACTSESQVCSHVLTAMGLSAERIDGAVRLSWCHTTELPDLEQMVERLARR